MNAPNDAPKNGEADAPKKSASTLLLERLASVVSDATVDTTTRDGIATVVVPQASWLAAAKALKAQGFVRFIDLTAVDRPEDESRFSVHVLVYSMAEQQWARLTTRTAGSLASLTPVYAGAHNYEREVYDLFGVTFDGHPYLTRILLPDAWKGHPLRRDEAMPVEPIDFTITRDVYQT